MRYGRFLFGVVLTLLLVGLVAGVGWTAYNAGITQGVVESGKLVVPSGEGNVVPAAPMYTPFRFYGAYGFRHPFGFGILGCLVPLFFVFLLFALLRFAFRPRWGGGPWMRGGWDSSQGDVPDRVKEWHRKLHEESSETKSQAA